MTDKPKLAELIAAEKEAGNAGGLDEGAQGSCSLIRETLPALIEIAKAVGDGAVLATTFSQPPMRAVSHYKVPRAHWLKILKALDAFDWEGVDLG